MVLLVSMGGSNHHQAIRPVQTFFYSLHILLTTELNALNSLKDISEQTSEATSLYNYVKVVLLLPTLNTVRFGSKLGLIHVNCR